MLIRSQDKAFLLNFNNLTAIYIEKIDKDFAIVYNDFEDAYTLGEYSTKAKAMKVPDMTQEAYANAESIPMVVPNIGKMFQEAPASKENELLAEAIGKVLMNKMVFQMPENSEVEE